MTQSRREERSEKGNKASGKLERGANDDSSFHLNAPDNAVAKSTDAILLENGTPIILVETRGNVEKTDFEHWFQHIDTAIGRIER
jgi:hypothetical protein